MRHAPEFRRTIRSGRRAARGCLVVHCVLRPAVGSTTTPEAVAGATAAPAVPTRVGFVVSRAVGGAVVRNRVKRRLRALMADRLQTTPVESLVVRALPAAAGADSVRLGADLDAALAACSGSGRRPAGRRPAAGAAGGAR